MRRCFCFSYVAWGGTHCGLIWIFNISPVFTLLATKSTFQIYSIWNMSSEKLFWNRQFFNVCIDSNLRKEQINGIKFSFENCYSNQVFDVSNQCLSQMPFFECLIQFKLSKEQMNRITFSFENCKLNQISDTLNQIFRTILLQLQVILFYEQIFKRWSREAKERIIGADLRQKYGDLIKKYLVQGFMSKIWISHTKILCAKNLKILYNNMTRGAPPLVLLLLLLLRQAAYFSVSNLEPMISCATL